MAYEGKNDFTARKNNKELSTREETEGIGTKGYEDVSGVYPRPEYQGRSDIDMSATGDEILSVRSVGSNSQIEIPSKDPIESVYPHNQTWTTNTGHTIQMDDTPGNNRILIRHHNGSGVELTDDECLILASKGNTIRIVAGEEKVIVEGHAHMVYNSGLDIDVNGDLNINVSGNMTTDVVGYKTDHVREDMTQVFDKKLSTFVQGEEEHSVTGLYRMSSETGISAFTVDYIVKSSTWTQSAANMKIDGNEYYLHSPYMYLYGKHGAIGGVDMDFRGDTFKAETTIHAGTTIYADTTMAAPSFIGKLKGKADDACKSDYATTAGQAPLGSAGSPSSQSHNSNGTETIEYPIITKFGTDDTSDSTYGSHFEYVTNILPIESQYELMKVNKQLGVDKYMEATGGVMNHKPTAAEVPSLLERYPDNAELKAALKADGLYNE